MVEHSDRPWRVGMRAGCAIFAQLGDSPSDEDPLIGTFDTPDLARAAVAAHNATLGSEDIRYR